MVRQFHITLPAFPRGFHLIDKYILEAISDAGSGILHVFIQHTSAGLCINENADPTVLMDFETVFNQLVPEEMPYYKHVMEGSDDMPAHIKAALTGHAVSIPITDGRLQTGTWQGIYLCEFRNHGGTRRLVATILS